MHPLDFRDLSRIKKILMNMVLLLQPSFQEFYDIASNKTTLFLDISKKKLKQFSPKTQANLLKKVMNLPSNEFFMNFSKKLNILQTRVGFAGAEKCKKKSLNKIGRNLGFR